MEKRCFNQTEALAYLGVKLKFFQNQIRPRLKGVKAGVSMIYERADLDRAWEEYKLATCGAGPEDTLWDVQRASTRRKTVDLTSTGHISAHGFDSAASKVLSMRKAG